MVLVRTTFQIKFGHMEEMLAIMKEAADSGTDTGNVTRILTDATGQMFTLVMESKADSIDAHMAALMESYGDPRMIEFMKRSEPHIESGRREFYTIEWEA